MGMGGTLTAMSEGRNRGATFTCIVPLLRLPPGTAHDGDCVLDEVVVAAPSPRQADDGPPRALRVLVAEDDKLCAALMRKILVRLRVAGTIVGDGAAAVAAYSSHQGALPSLSFCCAAASHTYIGCMPQMQTHSI